MRAVMIQDTEAELTSNNTSCISCSPLGAFVIVISDTHSILDVHGEQWRVPIADLVFFMQTHGELI